MCRSHDSDRDGSQEVGIGPGASCGLTHRAAPPRTTNLGSLQTRGNSLDPLRDAVDVARRGICGNGGLGVGGARPAPPLPEGLVRVGQLVGYDESGEQQQPRFTNLSDTPDELRDLCVDILAEAADAGLLPVD